MEVYFVVFAIGLTVFLTLLVGIPVSIYVLTAKKAQVSKVLRSKVFLIGCGATSFLFYVLGEQVSPLFYFLAFVFLIPFSIAIRLQFYH